MIGSMINRLTGMIRGTENANFNHRRNVRRFQPGLGIEGLEGRLAPAGFGMGDGFNAAFVDGFGGGQRDLITVGLPTNADLEEPTETTTTETDPVDMNLTPTPIGEGGSLIA
ncbi:MAG: hypothetical protein AB7I30_04315 [Isosphaeraceae bacterium]